MILIKTPKHKLFHEYLTWLNPLLHLSKGELDILASFITLHYRHKDYNPETLKTLLFSPETKEVIRKKLKVNTRLFNKLLTSLEIKGFIKDGEIVKQLTNYPKDNDFKLFVSFKIE